MEEITNQSQPVAFGGSSSVTVGVSWQKSLGASEAPGRVIQALLRSAAKALTAHFEGRAVTRLDSESATLTVTLRIPEPEGSTKMCDVSVTLLVDELTREDDAAELVVVPRIRTEVYRRKDNVDWFAHDAAADVEQLTFEIENVLSAVSP